jgi:hypothetical protein
VRIQANSALCSGELGRDDAPGDEGIQRSGRASPLRREGGDSAHLTPFRRAVVRRIPTGAEFARVPEITPAIFWKILKFVPKKR